MKLYWLFIATSLLLVTDPVFGQGALTPPGAPAPTMRTLQQVEPRIPISSAPVVITQPGSYYLTTNLTVSGGSDGITIAADNVTLDLMGFTLQGGGGSGVFASGRQNLVIRNGIIRGWGLDGIQIEGVANIVLRDLQCTANGRDGVATGSNSLVIDCLASQNGDDGFSGVASNRFERCSAQGNGYGFYATGAGNRFSQCEARGSTNTGMYLYGGNVAAGNTLIANGSAGLRLLGVGSYVADNIVKGNNDNYDIAAGNQLNLLLSEVPESIDWPAHVVLAGSLSVTSGNAITITADNVTLDLGGHTLSSTEATPTGTAILLSGGRAHIHILNGHIKGNVTETGGVFSGSGFGYGIYYTGGMAHNVRVTGVSVSGCQYSGIHPGDLDEANVVESCTVYTVGGVGIQADTVTGSSAHNCGIYGIYAMTASHCRGRSIGSYGGVYAYTANNCYGYSVGSGTGLSAYTAHNCYGESSSGTGLSALVSASNCYGYSTGVGTGLDSGIAIGCRGQSSSGTGLSTDIANSCVGSSSSGTGLSATIAHSCIGSGSPALNVTYKYNMP